MFRKCGLEELICSTQAGENYVAVSYTHLDVYKRQVYGILPYSIYDIV